MTTTTSQSARSARVRLAMGARRSQILSRFLLHALCVTLIGCIAGLLLSAGTGHLLAGMLILQRQHLRTPHTSNPFK
jgi:ABC-type antimicrobial peptide transport system permease subunit